MFKIIGQERAKPYLKGGRSGKNYWTKAKIKVVKKLLVPTDFSDAATNAVRYAGGLAAALGAEMVIFHAYQVVKTSEMFVSVREYIEEDLESESKTLFDSLRKLFGEDLKVSYKYREGHPVDAIGLEARHGGYDLVVIGTTGQSSVEKFFMGSVAKGLLDASPAPLLLVPHTAQFTPIRSIVVATEGQYLQNPELFEPFMDWAGVFNSKVDLFYHRPEDEIELDIEKHFTWDGIPFTLHIQESNEGTHEALDRFFAEQHGDVLVLLHHHREFWSRLFKSSFTREQTKHTRVPVLVLPI